MEGQFNKVVFFWFCTQAENVKNSPSDYLWQSIILLPTRLDVFHNMWDNIVAAIEDKLLNIIIIDLNKDSLKWL